ncbi:hypothetical protein CDD83_3458 [Cordyceps sp. RAO-2017]|nr:hypothetical protein CDD83_3458 [Cordyceps sp. RAO-2017]
MPEASLQDRLRDHAKAFDGLLSLIPAKMYYGEDTSDQWKRKKQTKQEAAAARRAKLDPDSELNRNAKEVMDERANNKRKLRELQQEDDQEEAADDDGSGDGAIKHQDDEPSEAVAGIATEKPGEGLRKKAAKKQRLQGRDAEDENQDGADGPGPAESPTKLSRKEETRAAKREKKAEKKAESKANRAQEWAVPGAGDDIPTVEQPLKNPTSNKEPSRKKASSSSTPLKCRPPPFSTDSSNASSAEKDSIEDVISCDVPASSPSRAEHSRSSASESECPSPTFDTDQPTAPALGAAGEVASATTSVSSVVPASEKPKHIKIPADTTALRARLAAKIEALRAARKADGPDGKPIRTRQELIEARRAKQAQRKAHKKELRKQSKLEEARRREEALASNSPGVMSPSVELDESTGNFSFGRVVFGDGSQMSHDLSYVLQQGKRKGPSDPKTALLKVQNQKKRLEELDGEKRADVADKEAWLTARRRVEGDKIRDDEAMLKKAVKRKETAKKKSEKAWQERARGIEQAQKDRQKKREENIKKRREDKVLGKAGKKKKGGPAKKVGGRPGFEGSFGVGGRKK